MCLSCSVSSNMAAANFSATSHPAFKPSLLWHPAGKPAGACQQWSPPHRMEASPQKHERSCAQRPSSTPAREFTCSRYVLG